MRITWTASDGWAIYVCQNLWMSGSYCGSQWKLMVGQAMHASPLNWSASCFFPKKLLFIRWSWALLTLGACFHHHVCAYQCHASTLGMSAGKEAASSLGGNLNSYSGPSLYLEPWILLICKQRDCVRFKWLCNSLVHVHCLQCNSYKIPKGDCIVMLCLNVTRAALLLLLQGLHQQQAVIQWSSARLSAHSWFCRCAHVVHAPWLFFRVAPIPCNWIPFYLASCHS